MLRRPEDDMNMETILLGIVVFQLAGLMYLFTGNQKLKGLIRTALRKAEADNCEMVRMPYNQVAEALGWEPEYDDDVRTSVYPFRSRRDFTKSNERHPATLSPARRKKL
jgi:hypothetical protein